MRDSVLRSMNDALSPQTAALDSHATARTDNVSESRGQCNAESLFAEGR